MRPRVAKHEEAHQPPAESEVYTGCGCLSNLFHYNRHSSNIDRSYVAVYINYEATIFSDGTSKRSPNPKTYKKSYYFFAKTLDFFASLLYHGEVLKRNVMNINRLRYRRGKREWNGL